MLSGFGATPSDPAHVTTLFQQEPRRSAINKRGVSAPRPAASPRDFRAEMMPMQTRTSGCTSETAALVQSHGFTPHSMPEPEFFPSKVNLSITGLGTTRADLCQNRSQQVAPGLCNSLPCRDPLLSDDSLEEVGSPASAGPSGPKGLQETFRPSGGLGLRASTFGPGAHTPSRWRTLSLGTAIKRKINASLGWLEMPPDVCEEPELYTSTLHRLPITCKG